MKLYQTYYEVHSAVLCEHCSQGLKEIMPWAGECEGCALRISPQDLSLILRLAILAGLENGGVDLPKTQEDLAALIARAKKLQKLLP